MRFRPRPGFSLVELFVALVVVAILVGLAIPRFRAYKRKYFITAMTSDLRNLAATEEAYWSKRGSYTSDVTALKFVASPGVLVSMVSADSMGWSARTTHENEDATCAIYYGAAPMLPPATVKNFIGCSK
jgi:prepilin-type N-terminal cleavage/methylation domain-containing protein